MLLLLVSVQATAQADEVLQWQDCVSLAIKQNSVLHSAAEKIKLSEATKNISRSGLLPQINGNAGETLSREYPSSKEGDTSKNYSYGVSTDMLLFDGFKNSNELAGAKATLRAAEYDYMVVSSDVRLGLRTAFVDLLRAQDLISMTKEIAQRQKSNFEMVSLRYDAGLEHKGSLLTAEANYRQAESEAQQAERSLLLGQVALNKELGFAGLHPVQVQGSLDIDISERVSPDFERLVEVSPFLKELMAKKEASSHSLKAAKADLFPKIYATGSGRRAGDSLPVGKSGESWSYGLSVSFPLFTGGNKTAQIDKAKASLALAQADEAGGREGAFLAMVRSWIAFQNAQDLVETANKFLAASEEMASVTRAQYDLGLASFNDWTIIEDNLVNKTKNYLDARAGALTAEAQWVQAKGGILDDEVK